MYLPDISYKPSLSGKEITQFPGLNRRDGAQDGEATDMRNLTARRYPFLATRQGREQLGEYSSPTDLFSWDKLLVVDNGVLYYDGTPLDNVSAVEKQFAVVNTKLCIFPDKKYIDLVNGEFRALDATAVTAMPPTLTHNTLTAAVTPTVAENITRIYGGSSVNWSPNLYTYGNDPDALSWSEEEGWTLPEPVWTGMLGTGHGATKSLNKGDIFIPYVSENYYDFVWEWPGMPDRSRENQLGYYGIITNIDGWISTTDGNTTFTYDVYKKGLENKLFSSLFAVGDRVTVTGFTVLPMNNVEDAPIVAIDDKTNSLVFADNTFATATAVYTTGETEAGWTKMTYAFCLARYSYLRFSTDEPLPVGTVVYYNSKGLYYYDGKQTYKPSYTSYESYDTNYLNMIATAYSGEEINVTIQRRLPDLDFVCENKNRLWGVSNRVENKVWNQLKQCFETVRSRVIYASALGDPTNFFVYDGLSTDSYAVAVASQGDFTGIYAYSGNVLCWKDRLLHRITGDNPSSYYLYTDSFDGVEPGANKTQQIINEVLYYKGTDGVYAYSGGTPSLISYPLGAEHYTGRAAGAVGTDYYLSLTDEQGQGHLMVYDTIHRLWHRQDSTVALGFAGLDGVHYFCDKTAVWRMGGDTPADMPWSVTFAPMIDGDFVQYRWLSLSFWLGKGAQIRVKITVDDGQEKTVGQSHRPGWNRLRLPLPSMRCQQMLVTLEGQGPFALRSLTRQWLDCSQEV